jgi:Cof subfamily protein (haloacid dehalogenase superfamily)
MIRLLAIDLDGTLLNSAKQISAATEAILHAARELHGVQIVLASARPPRSVANFYRQLRLDTPNINYNGALVYYPLTGQVLLHRPLPLDITLGLVDLARRVYPEVLVSAERLDHWYTDRLDPAYPNETARFFKPDVVAPIHEWLTVPMTKLLLLGRQERLADLAAAIERQFTYQVSMVQTEDNLLQIMHVTAGKAAALRTVAAHLHVPRQAVLAIGDNANDVGMLQWAGIGVAMGNACPAAKAAADYVTDHHDADGAAHALRRLLVTGGLPE